VSFNFIEDEPVVISFRRVYKADTACSGNLTVAHWTLRAANVNYTISIKSTSIPTDPANVTFLEPVTFNEEGKNTSVPNYYLHSDPKPGFSTLGGPLHVSEEKLRKQRQDALRKR
jgi:hypothetical protein